MPLTLGKRKRMLEKKETKKKKQTLFKSVSLRSARKNEKKYFSSTLVAQTVTNTGLVSSIFQPTLGSSVSDRTANVVTVISLNMRYDIFIAANNNIPYSINVSIIYDKSPNGVTVPTLTGDAGSIYNGDQPHDNTLIANHDRFVTLYSDDIVLKNVSGLTGYIVDTYLKSQYLKLALPSKFRQNNGNITDFNSGAFYLIVRNTNSYGITLNFDSKFGFYDA